MTRFALVLRCVCVAGLLAVAGGAAQAHANTVRSDAGAGAESTWLGGPADPAHVALAPTWTATAAARFDNGEVRRSFDVSGGSPRRSARRLCHNVIRCTRDLHNDAARARVQRMGAYDVYATTLPPPALH